MRILRFLTALSLFGCLGSCVTSSDLMAISDQLAEVERVAADSSASDEEVRAEFGGLREVIDGVVDRTAAEAQAWWESGEGLAGGGVLGGVVTVGSMLLTNLYRNRLRRRRGEPVKVEDVA